MARITNDFKEDRAYWEAIQAQERAEEDARWKAKCELEIMLNNGVEEKKEKKPRRVWSEEEIKFLVQTNDKVLYGSLRQLYDCQTADEKSAGHTKVYNGRGFNGADSQFLSSVSEFLLKKGYLTEKQKHVVRKKLVKYNKQITALANAYEEKRA